MSAADSAFKSSTSCVCQPVPPVLLYMFGPGAAETAASGGVSEEEAQFGREVDWISGFYQQSRLPVEHYFGYRSDATGHNRHSTGHGLGGDHPETLRTPDCGEDEYRRLSEHTRKFFGG